MSDPADNGWAPPDPGMAGGGGGGRRPEPDAPQEPQAAAWPEQVTSTGAQPGAEPGAPQPRSGPRTHPGSQAGAAPGPEPVPRTGPWEGAQADELPPPYPFLYGAPYGTPAPQPYPPPPPQHPPAPYPSAPHQRYPYAHGGSPPPPGRPGMPYPGYGPPGHAPPGYGHAVPVRRSWVVPTPPGTPYHRMARTAAHRWWRPWVGSLAILVGGLTATIALAVVVLAAVTLATGRPPEVDPDGSLVGNDLAELGLALAGLAIFLPFAMLVPWLVQRRRPGTVSSVAGRLRRRWLLLCCGIAVVFCLVSLGTSWLAGLVVDDPAPADEHWAGWRSFLTAAAVIVALVPFQAAAEEYVFRGWVLQAVGACTLETRRGRVGRAFSRVFRTPWPGIVIGAALFTSGHGYTGWGVLDVFAFGVIAGWLAVRTGGLEAAIALHVFNNLMAFLLSAAVGRLDIVQGAVPWPYVVADVVPMLLYAAVVSWLVKRLKVRTVVPEASAPDAPAAVPAAPGAAVASAPGANATAPAGGTAAPAVDLSKTAAEPEHEPGDAAPADDLPADDLPADDLPVDDVPEDDGKPRSEERTDDASDASVGPRTGRSRP